MKQKNSNSSGAWIGVWTAIGTAFSLQKPKIKKNK